MVICGCSSLLKGSTCFSNLSSMLRWATYLPDSNGNPSTTPTATAAVYDDDFCPANATGWTIPVTCGKLLYYHQNNFKYSNLSPVMTFCAMMTVHFAKCDYMHFHEYNPLLFSSRIFVKISIFAIVFFTVNIFWRISKVTVIHSN